MSVLLAIFLSIVVTVNCQRSPYAGSRPSGGYKDTYIGQSASSSAPSVGDRVGETSTSTTNGGTTNRLPVDAYGDKFIVDHYNSLPVEQRPFWILNQEQINLHRGQPPQQLAGSTGSNNIQSSTNAAPAGNGATTLGERFGETNNFNPYQQLPTVGNYQEIVYPINATPIQRIDIEIQYLQNRLESLQKQRQQLSQPQSQSSQQKGQLNQQGQQTQQRFQQRNQRSPYEGEFF